MMTVSVLPAPIETPLSNVGRVWIKLEPRQRTGSVKYRMVYARLRKALGESSIPPGTILTEVSSGSTGAALAVAGGTLGLPVEIHAYESIAPQKRSQIEGAGARLILHPGQVPVSTLLEAVREKVRSGGYWHLGQYDRRSIVESYEGLSAELIGQLRAAGIVPQVFLCPVGTGGIIQSLGASLRKAYPGIRVVALEPVDGSSIDGIRNTERFHLGAEDPYDRSFPDDVLRVPRAEPVLRAIGNIYVGGARAAVRTIELRRSLKQHIDIEISAPRTPAPFTAEDVKRYFR
jgi:cysteine synthase